MFEVIRSARIPISALIAGIALVATQTVCAAKRSELPGRPAGTLRNVEVYAPPSSYAAFPCLMRTKKELIIEFGDQSLKRLREVGLHPHYAPVAVRKYAVSMDNGLTWRVRDSLYPLNRGLLVTTRGDYFGAIVLPKDELLRLSMYPKSGTKDVEPLTLSIRRTSKRDIVSRETVTPEHPLGSFHPFSIVRVPDGSLLAAGYGSEAGEPSMSSAFLRSLDNGRRWEYLSKIPGLGKIGMAEPGLVALDDGRIVVMLRAEWSISQGEEFPADVNGDGDKRDGYGYYLYQSESSDSGKSWAEPKRLPIWGHPGFLVKLQSGNVLLVYGHRRPPFSVRAVLSRDGCRTWDLSKMKTLRTFEPGNYDIGYPVALQLDDGTICCTCYGYSSSDTSEFQPHGIFVSLFDEKFMESE